MWKLLLWTATSLFYKLVAFPLKLAPLLSHSTIKWWSILYTRKDDVTNYIHGCHVSISLIVLVIYGVTCSLVHRICAPSSSRKIVLGEFTSWFASIPSSSLLQTTIVYKLHLKVYVTITQFVHCSHILSPLSALPKEWIPIVCMVSSFGDIALDSR